VTLYLQFKGFNYVDYYNGGYENADSLPQLAAVGANAVAMPLEYGIDLSTSDVYDSSNFTDSLTALGEAIQQAVTLGMSVMVRPLVDFLDPTQSGADYGDWRETFNPSDPSAFFASYKTMVVAQAQVAQANGASSFCIGTELDQLTGPAYYNDWAGIITAVRNVFHGALTYSASWDDDTSPWAGSNGLGAGTGNLATQVSFWKLLDYIGIDEYAPLSDASDPTVAQLIDGWTQTPTISAVSQVTGGESLVDYYEGVAASIDAAAHKTIPLIFTEIGYESATDAASQPFASSTNAYDPTLQANLYTAFFDAWRQAGNSALTGVYFWNWDPNVSEVGPDNGSNFSPQLPAQSVVESNFAACYARGTAIAVPGGEVPVQTLRAGDLVLTASGAAREVVWVGHRDIVCARQPQPEAFWPVRVRAHAFGRGRPHRDLLLSRDHAVFVDGVLIPVRYLVNGATVVREARETVSYWHVELQRHDLLLAEGLACESFLDTGNRGAFANGGAYANLHPDFARRVWAAQGCATLATEGPAVAAARRGLRRRAAALGWRSVREPGLHVLADAQAVWPERRGGRYRFHLPAVAGVVRLRSRSAVAAEVLEEGGDERRLGVAVSGLALDGRAIGEGRLRDGWHAAEDGGWRWTDGDCGIAVCGGAVLDVEVAMTVP
jgi:hypothetical protein